MTKANMFRAEFKLKKSPYPLTQVKDYPNTKKTLDFLESKLAFIYNNKVKMPEAMFVGLAYKMEHTRKELAKPYSKFFSF